VPERDAEVLLVEGGPRVLLEFEAVPRDQREHPPPRAEPLVRSGALLGPKERAAGGLGGVGDVVLGVPHGLPVAGDGGGRVAVEGERRRQVVVVPHARGRGDGGRPLGEGPERVGHRAVGLARGEVAGGVAHDARVVLLHVGDHQPLALAVVFEPVERPHLLHPALGEIVVALAVLAHMEDRAVPLVEAEHVVRVGREPRGLQRRVEHLAERLVDEHLAVPVERGEPELRRERHAQERALVPRGLDHDAVGGPAERPVRGVRGASRGAR